MTSLELEAIRALPAEWVRDGVDVRTVGECVVASHCALVPMCYRDGRWSELTFEQSVHDQLAGRLASFQKRLIHLWTHEPARVTLPKPLCPWERPKQEPGRSRYF